MATPNPDGSITLTNVRVWAQGDTLFLASDDPDLVGPDHEYEGLKVTFNGKKASANGNPKAANVLSRALRRSGKAAPADFEVWARRLHKRGRGRD